MSKNPSYVQIVESTLRDHAKQAESPLPQPDYYEIRYLKKAEAHGMWEPAVQFYPTREDAEATAKLLSEGRQSAIKIIPRQWG